MTSPQEKVIKKRPGSTARKIKRNQRLAERFTELYEKQRLRLDDVYDKLADEFFIQKKYIQQILSSRESV